ncbi:NmrA family NAD(P)-binding protein [Azospirillum picis]|uniref:Uncharacterized protein YbjT (DUF2867 family) n=1 Tax=Azospirillum picis TaxID=488438 RepID=A0ABU0MPQ8_9PROT|nr:NmrA family NAD(P)-binding protein [Azospirillum picis]MBP2301368.1 uncharacterized protein YbjT (DUF2867 family) [Azospirillum picis]MDQ0535199.1 uncharacterized protein YbjT (DUF2867 family) [Azospirillum picis]
MSADHHSGTSGPRIAIAGATGRVGATLISLLASDPVETIALTRDPRTATLPEGVAVAAIDFDRPETLWHALRGAERLFLAHGTSPRQVENEVALIDAAVAANVRHIVKLSALCPATRLTPFAWHMKIEAHLARQAIAATVLRPSAFFDVLKRSGPQIAGGAWAGAATQGRVNFIDTRDIAKVARVALLEKVHPHSQRAYHLTGARAWTMQEIAQELSALLGRRINYGSRTLEEQHAALLGSGLSPLIADLLTGLDQMFRDSALSETTATVRELTGSDPRTLHDWLIDNLAVFQS